MNRQHYHEHRIPTSLERFQPRQPVSEGYLRKLVADAREAGVIVFLQADLAKLEPFDRAIIEGAAQRFAKGTR
jgi:hypothetical protein